MEMDAGPQHANPMGTLHGGVICDVADAAMGTAMATTLEDDESFTTLSLTADYFKPVWTQKLRATARVTKRTLYSHFRSKDDLLAVAFQLQIELMEGSKRDLAGQTAGSSPTQVV